MRFLAVLALAGCLGVAACGCTETTVVGGPGHRKVTELTSGWTLSVDGGPSRAVTVPNDWAIAGPFVQSNPSGQGGGYAPGGVATYTRTLEIPDVAGKSAFLQFDGIMANSEIYLDGKLIASHPYGYSPIEVSIEVSEGRHELRVKTDTSQQPASRWYTGAGIYRPARLVITDPAHIYPGGIFVSTPSASARKATISVAVKASSIYDFTTRVTVFDPKGQRVASSDRFEFETTNREPGTPLFIPSETKQATLTLDHPELWDIGHGAMYSARVELVGKGEVVDSVTVPFGIRESRFEPATGYWINGRNVKLKGACLHQDGGAVGAAVPAAVYEARLTALREIGVNAIRTAHNPPDPAFLDLCDKMGFVVMDEMFDCWRVGKNKFDYHLDFAEWSEFDVAATVKRHRNHPSIILYSAGNEIHDTPDAEAAKKILAGLVKTFHENDPTRPVTQALFRPNASGDYEDGLADMLDVVGQNYRERELQAAADQKPSRKIIGTENGHGRPAWLVLRDDPRVAGQFLWTGVDYLGESHGWPRIGNSSGLLDRTGEMKPMAYERQSWWSDKPMVYAARRVAPRAQAETDPGYGQYNTARDRETLFGDWTPANPAPHEETVEVYSNCRSVELFLNDRSLGALALNSDASPRVWKVPFEPGTLRAVTDTGQAFSLRTAGKPAAIKLWSDRQAVGSSFDDALIVRATVVDANGVVVPSATPEITFDVGEPGQLIAVDNGNPSIKDAFTGKTVHASHGKCVAIVRGVPNREAFTVRATAEGLAGAERRIAIVSKVRSVAGE